MDTNNSMVYCPASGAKSQFDIVQLSNQHYHGHLDQQRQQVWERQMILSLVHPDQDEHCDHNLPTPCPPSTPIFVQYTNLGHHPIQYVQLPDTRYNARMDFIHSNHYEHSAIAMLNTLSQSTHKRAVQMNICHTSAGSAHRHQATVHNRKRRPS